LEQFFEGLALSQAFDIFFGHPHAMMSGNGALDADHPFIARRMFNFNHAL